MIAAIFMFIMICRLILQIFIPVSLSVCKKHPGKREIIEEIILKCMHRKMCKNTGKMPCKKSYNTNGIRQLLLLDAGWKEPKGYMTKQKTKKHFMKTVTLSGKKRMAVH